jgi:ribonuclease Z
MDISCVKVLALSVSKQETKKTRDKAAEKVGGIVTRFRRGTKRWTGYGLRPSYFSGFGTSPGLLAAIVFLGVGCSAGLQDQLVDRVIESRMANQTDPLAGDGLKVLICGSSSPLPSREAAGPCVAVAAGGHIWIVDAGDGSGENLNLWGIQGGSIEGVLLTHFHSDHIEDLQAMNLQSWIAGRLEPLPVYGPEGVEDVVDGFQLAYKHSHKYRTAHHGADILPAAAGDLRAVPFGIREGDPTGTEVEVFSKDGLRVRAVKVEHAPVDPAVAYRFDYRGRSVVISGDTTASEAVVALSRDADVLVHEALAAHIVDRMTSAAKKAGNLRIAKITEDIQDYHATPVQVAQIANRANARLLVYYHMVPYPENALIGQVWLRGVSDVRSKGVELSHDGMLIDLPPDSEEIEIEDIN